MIRYVHSGRQMANLIISQLREKKEHQFLCCVLVSIFSVLTLILKILKTLEQLFVFRQLIVILLLKSS